jgi:hypothetical protein
MKTGIRTANGAGGGGLGGCFSRRSRPLDSGELLAAARHKTGLDDFGEPPVEPALSVLTRSLEEEADLHPRGRFLMRAHLVGLLMTRLRLVRAWSRQGGAAASPVRRPIFITGMPRSGSTFLHELMTQDAGHRAPRVWEVMMPVEAREPDRGWRDARVWKTAACLWCYRRMVRQADAIYPLRARTPQECIAIHGYTFMTEEFVTSCRVPAYRKFLRASDLRPVYEWEKRFLQHLQGPNPGRRWLLKSPDHAFGLEALFSVFPDVLIIQTHRDPLEVLRSMIHLTSVLQGLYARPGSMEALAEREAQALLSAMDRFVRFRDAHPELEGQFVDVHYAELAADPPAVIRRIYRQFGMPLTETTAERMRQLAQGRARYPGRQHVPTLAEAGVDVPAQVGRFQGYCHRFGITCQPAGAR